MEMDSLCVRVRVCVCVRVHAHAFHGAHVEVRGPTAGVSSLLSSLQS